MVGGEDQVNKVIDLLLKSESNLEVISITGMIGSGKTTLARRVFKHSISTLKSMFSLSAFVSVPQEYNTKKINVLLEILRQFGKEKEIDGKEEAELVEILGDCLNNSSFLIVLDDVYSPEVLDDIRSLILAQQQQGNQENQKKVLLAVRSGKRMGIYEKNEYELPLLDLNKSQELLRMEIFGERDKKYSMELEVLEKKILEKCHNLPLAIVSVGRILARRRKKIEWWKKVAEHVNVFTERESLINKAIRAIFEGLNDNLKLCFLYLGLFKKGFKFPAWVLLRLWMAEGLVGEGEEGNRNNKSIEEVAEDYLEELVDRNLVLVNKRRSDGKIKSIGLHDGVHDFCKSEAKEENIFRESFFSETCRRICIRNSLVSQFHNSIPKSTTPTNSLRSILYFSDSDISSYNNIPEPLFKVIFNNVTKPFRRNRTKPAGILPDGESFPLFLSSVPKTFKLLRVLHVRSFMLTEFPTALFSLFLLRYVAVSCKSSFLPKELSNLCNLQTLIILTWSESETLEIRADLRDMPLLRHIHSNKSIVVRKLKKRETKIGNGSVINKNLQTISRISLKCCTKELFENVPNLEKLGVSGKLSVEGGIGTNNKKKKKYNLFDHIVELNGLRNLKLLNDEDDYASSKSVLPPIHSGSFPKSLTSLTLSNTCLVGENMSSIGKLENLQILKLQFIKFAKRFWKKEDDGCWESEDDGFWKSEDGGFLKLRVLHLKVTNLAQWKASWNHFPRLASLVLWHCKKLETLPVGLLDILCLETVDLFYGHYNLASSLKTMLLPKLENHPGFKLKIFPEYK